MEPQATPPHTAIYPACSLSPAPTCTSVVLCTSFCHQKRRAQTNRRVFWSDLLCAVINTALQGDSEFGRRGRSVSDRPSPPVSLRRLAYKSVCIRQAIDKQSVQTSCEFGNSSTKDRLGYTHRYVYTGQGPYIEVVLKSLLPCILQLYNKLRSYQAYFCTRSTQKVAILFCLSDESLGGTIRLSRKCAMKAANL